MEGKSNIEPSFLPVFFQMYTNKLHTQTFFLSISTSFTITRLMCFFKNNSVSLLPKLVFFRTFSHSAFLRNRTTFTIVFAFFLLTLTVQKKCLVSAGVVKNALYVSRRTFTANKNMFRKVSKN